MTLTDHQQAILDHNTHMRHITAGALGSTQQSLLHEEMRLLVDVLPAGDRLVIVHLGLDGNAMLYGFSFVKGRASDGGLDYDDPESPSHYLDEGYLRSITAAEWAPFHDAYHTQVLIDRGDEQGYGPLTEVDPRAVVLPWDSEIDAMYQTTVQDEDGPFRLVLSSVCVHHDSSDGGPEGFRHGVAFHVEQRRLTGWTAMLDDTDHPGMPYRFKADDYGSLCPPGCARFER